MVVAIAERWCVPWEKFAMLTIVSSQKMAIPPRVPLAGRKLKFDNLFPPISLPIHWSMALSFVYCMHRIPLLSPALRFQGLPLCVPGY
jgi:hypothetical protein